MMLPVQDSSKLDFLKALNAGPDQWTTMDSLGAAIARHYCTTEKTPKPDTTEIKIHQKPDHTIAGASFTVGKTLYFIDALKTVYEVGNFSSNGVDHKGQADQTLIMTIPSKLGSTDNVLTHVKNAKHAAYEMRIAQEPGMLFEPNSISLEFKKQSQMTDDAIAAIPSGKCAIMIDKIERASSLLDQADQKQGLSQSSHTHTPLL